MPPCRTCLDECCSGAALFLCNGVDLACGIALLGYSSYLGVNHFAPEWLYGPILGVGALLVLTALCSWCGSSCSSCTNLLLVSSWLLVLVALLELVLSIVIFTQGDTITAFLKEHQMELKLTDKELELLEAHKFVPAYMLLALFVMELLRFCCSSYLRRARTCQALNHVIDFVYILYLEAYDSRIYYIAL